MDAPVTSRAGHTIRVSQPAPRSAAKAAASKLAADEDDDDDDDDDDELSDPLDSDEGDQTMAFGDETIADEDAEGEEIEVAGEDDEDEEEEDEEEEDAEGEEVGDDAEAGSDDGSREGTPDLTKMTKRQRARFEDEPQEYMKLSDGMCIIDNPVLRWPVTNGKYRGSSEEGLYSRGALHATAGNGPTPSQSQ